MNNAKPSTPDTVLYLFGYSAFATPLFVLFHDELSLPLRWIERIDLFLALSVVIFFAKLLWLMAGLYEAAISRSTQAETHALPPFISKVVGLLLICSVGIIGVYFVEAAARAQTTANSATVFGFVMLGAASIMLFALVNRLIKTH